MKPALGVCYYPEQWDESLRSIQPQGVLRTVGAR